MDDLDLKYLKLSYELAAEFSTDPSTQNGAIIVAVDQDGVDWVHGEAANHFPTGVVETAERWQRPQKYWYVEHAERGAIYAAAKQGTGTKGGTMYVGWAACCDCARAIIESGISRVFTHHDPFADTRFGQPVSEQWKESIAVALQMLKEAGVKLDWTDAKLFPDDSVSVRYNGKIVHP